ncbi:hypothetical protein BDA96_01G240000 [Sorghum bicolor]|uniref:Uncharacterized protein n=2 Tax=Sorghum bicolor TaxID=4558 RepID=A0A921S0D1_SORBI|nr:uncharacterized protein LOC110433737 [Sorghum bicolor]KAG0549260.1 hypothetical protein BDA96_01G240000 [Sorghum bicolor]KXG38377.1 hypothetical protein SORBI_3001G225500 [Sorghum bicolor]|eukprot:XP_021311965.1 uncharacterized protein LOC110433737 [Sorghum bicolor]
MASLLSLYGSGGRRRMSRSSGTAAPVRRLLRRLRSSFGRSAARPRRRSAVRFGYDLHSYSQNFDDGVASSAPAAMACA